MICPITVLKEDRSEPACDTIILSGQGEWQSFQSVSTSGCKKFQTRVLKWTAQSVTFKWKKKKKRGRIILCIFMGWGKEGRVSGGWPTMKDKKRGKIRASPLLCINCSHCLFSCVTNNFSESFKKKFIILIGNSVGVRVPPLAFWPALPLTSWLVLSSVLVPENPLFFAWGTDAFPLEVLSAPVRI